MNPERQMVNKEVGTLNPNYCSLKEVSAEITSLILAHGDSCTISKEYSPYSDDEYLAVFKSVPETNEEMARRVAHEKQQHALKVDYEKETYLRLKKKFEKK